MKNSVVLSYAILTVNWDEKGTDYLENFVPIVAECVRRLPSDILSVQDVQKALKKNFKWHMPQNAINAIFRRLRKKGYINLEHNIYTRSIEKLKKLNFHETQQKVLLMHESLTAHLLEFSKEKFDLSWSEEEAENALHAYIEEFQIVLSNYNDKSPIIPPPDQIVTGSKYVVGTFIKHLEEESSSDFDYLVTIAKGNLLANAIYLTEPSQVTKKIKGTYFYFDTTFLIFALGYAGKPREEPCIELLELLYKTGANLRCFKHTLEEIRGVLDACAYRLRMGFLKDAYGPSIEYFLSMGLKPSDIELYALNLQKNLKALRVEVIEKPEYLIATQAGSERKYVYDYVIDEEKLTKELSDNIHYKNSLALQRDVDSVSAVMRERRGQEVYEVEDCRAIFVTTNNSLVKISREFFYKEASLGAIPPCIPDYVLTNLLWLKTPLGAPDLPRKRVIADCYAATQPDDRIWSKYLASIEKNEAANKITTDDYVMLRFAIEAKSAMMDITLGEEVAFTQGTITEILALAKSKIQHEKDSELTEEKTKRKSAEDEVNRLRLEKSFQDQERIHKIRARAQIYSNNISNAVEYGVLALLIVGTVSTFPWGFPTFDTSPVKYLISLLQFILLILSVINIYFGTTVKSWVRQFEVSLAHKIEVWLMP